MKKLLEQGTHLAAVAGIALCLVAGIGRVTGYHYIMEIEASSLFQAGIAGMVLACLLKLYQRP